MKITANTKISEIISNFPEAVAYLVSEYQFHCVNCFISGYETLVEGAKVHGIVGVDFDQMLEELNKITADQQSTQSKQPQTNIRKLTIVSIAGLLIKGPGSVDNLSVMEAINKKHGLLPAQYIEAFNTLLPLYLRGELKQQDFWEMINEKHNTTIDSNVNWFGNSFRPSLEGKAKDWLQTLKPKRVVGILCLGYERANIVEGLIAQLDLFDRIYRSDLIHSSKDEYRFWQQILAFEGTSAQQTILYSQQKIERTLATKLGIGIGIPLL